MPGETDSYGGTAEADWDEDVDEGGESGAGEEPQAKTADTLDEALKNLVDASGEENVYLEIPKLNLDKVIIANDEIHQVFLILGNLLMKEMMEIKQSLMLLISIFVEFKRSAQKIVNYLVKEFECKKAADSYARATTSRTGVLDCSKLHTYKYNEDLFKSDYSF